MKKKKIVYHSAKNVSISSNFTRLKDIDVKEDVLK